MGLGEQRVHLLALRVVEAQLTRQLIEPFCVAFRIAHGEWSGRDGSAVAVEITEDAARRYAQEENGGDPKRSARRFAVFSFIGALPARFSKIRHAAHCGSGSATGSPTISVATAFAECCGCIKASPP